MSGYLPYITDRFLLTIGVEVVVLFVNPQRLHYALIFSDNITKLGLSYKYYIPFLHAYILLLYIESMPLTYFELFVSLKGSLLDI